MLPADLYLEAVPALTSALLICAQIEALESHATPPASEDDLNNQDFHYLLDDADAVARFLEEPAPEFAEKLAALLGSTSTCHEI